MADDEARERIDARRLREVLSYDPETGEFFWLVGIKGVCAGDRAGGLSRSRGYWRIQLDGQRHTAHRLAWLYMTGEWPRDQIDHINGIRTDNRFANLREATNAQNGANSSKRENTTSKYKGVDRRGKRWRAQIRSGGKKYCLGMFDTPEEAYAAYCAAARKFHGEFARLT